jgi:membrane-bound metal-dependent hydrolase YbcI (DUF457 family)
MLLLGHTGITYAVVRTAEKLISHSGRKISGLIDYRLVFIGAILPDILDKPLGHIFLKDTLGNGRIFAHTLLFSLLLFLIGLFYWVKAKRPGILVLAVGSFLHLVFDSMWALPKTLFWPAYGWSFPQMKSDDYLWQVLLRLVTDPYSYVPELIGGFFLLTLLRELSHKKQLKQFLKTGKLLFNNDTLS